MNVPELDLTDLDVIRDPFTAYGRARESSPLARLLIPGLDPMWAITRHADGRAMLSDPRFELRAESFAYRPDVPEKYLPYLRTMQEMDGPEHLRLRRLAAPAFTARRAARFRPRIERIVESLLDGPTGETDLICRFTQPLPMAAICELVGIPESDRPRWREYGAAIVAGSVEGLAKAMPGVIEDAKAAAERADRGDDLISDLLAAKAEDGDRLTGTELVTLIWNIVLAGQTPANLIANGVAALLSQPDQLAALREDPGLMPRAVEELMRWCGPQLLSIPRYAREDVEIGGVLIGKGDSVTVSIASVNRDPRVFDDPERFDVRRDPGGHLGFAHGPHFCLGAGLARVQTEVALSALLHRFPGLALAAAPERALDPGTWRLSSLLVKL